MPVLDSWYRAESWRGTGIYSPSPETKCRLTTDLGVMPVQIQYRFQCWHGTDVQYRDSIDGQLPAKLPFGAAPMVGRAYASTAPVLQILLRYYCTIDLEIIRRKKIRHMRRHKFQPNRSGPNLE